jgi:hypothetical protein
MVGATEEACHHWAAGLPEAEAEDAFSVNSLQLFICVFLKVVPVTVAVIVMDKAHILTSGYSFPLACVAFFGGLWAGSLLEIWFNLGHIAYGLADESAAELSRNAATEVQTTQVMRRRLPPRQMYASAVARRSEPVVMYRGWRLFSARPLSQPENSRTPGLTCWRHR